MRTFINNISWTYTHIHMPNYRHKTEI